MPAEMPHVDRKIIHIDADCFFAAVEMRERPELRSRPLAVGGQPGQRGVIATCNYPARQFGVHSAQPSALALRNCPQLLILPPRFALYKEVSKQMRSIFSRYTDLIEPVSLDEAYLDVTACRHCRGSATLIAEAIRQAVASELGVTVSAGVAPNKFLAKVASDWNKPDGCFVIRPDQVAGFVKTLPVTRINGVGRVTAAKLARLGVETCGQLQPFPRIDLERYFGRFGGRLYQLARGVDARPVEVSRQRQSVSVERTLHQDVAIDALAELLPALLQELERRYRPLSRQYQPSKRIVKIKFADFSQTTLEEPLSVSGETWADAARFAEMFRVAWSRGGGKARLLGIGLRLQSPTDSGQQLDLFSF